MSAISSASSFRTASPDFILGRRAGLQQSIEQLQAVLRADVEGSKPLPGAMGSHQAIVARMIRSRAQRTKYFAQELFSEPAWDILLDLYASYLEQRRVSVTSACLASGAPTTTALRWIRGMEQEGLIVRRDDPFDRRRVYLNLSDSAVDAMGRYLRAEAASLDE